MNELNEEIGRILNIMGINEAKRPVATLTRKRIINAAMVELKTGLSSLPNYKSEIEPLINDLPNTRTTAIRLKIADISAKLDFSRKIIEEQKNKLKLNLRKKLINNDIYNKEMGTLEGRLTAITKAETKIYELTKKVDSDLNKTKAGKTQTRPNTKQQSEPIEPNVQQTKPDIKPIDTNTQKIMADPDARKAMMETGETPPPVNATADKKKRWLMKILASAAIPLSVKLLAALLVVGSVAGALIWLGKKLRGEGLSNDACFTDYFLNKYLNKNIFYYKTGGKKTILFTVKPTNPAALDIFKNGFILEVGSKNRRVYVNGKVVGSWVADENCSNLYVKIGTTKYAIFKTGQTAQQPATNTSGVGKKNTYRACRSTYQLYCYSNKIKELQQCLNIKVDGYWGRMTQTAVSNAGLPSPLTDEQINKFCSRRLQPQPAVPTQTAPPNQPENVTDNNASIETEF